MKQTILIAGGSGLVGKAIIAKLKSHAEVIILSRTHQSPEPGVTYSKWNPQHGEIDLEIVNRADVVINLAGETVNQRWTNEAKRRILESRVTSTKTLVTAINSTDGPKVLVNASAVGIYPDSLQWVEEETPNGTGFLAEVCAAWEAEAHELQSPHTLIITRIGMVLSEDGGALTKLKPLFNLGLGSPIGSGKQWQSWIHLDDLASAIIYLFGKRKAGIYNAVAPEPTTNKEFGAQLAKLLGRPYFLPAVPSFLLRLVLGEMSKIVLTSNRVSSEKLRKAGFQFNYSDLTSALRTFYKK